MMNPDYFVFAPVALPILGAAVALCAKAFTRGRISKTIEFIGIFIGLALPWLSFIQTFPLVFSGGTLTGTVGGWNAAVGIMYRFDGLAWLVNLLGFSVAGAAWIYSLGAGPRGPAFSAVFLIQTAALAATVMTADLFNLFVCLEVLGISSYVLVATSDKPGAALASFSYLMVSAAAMVFFLIGLYGLYRLTGALSYTRIAEGLALLPDGGGITALVSLALIVAAVAIRVAVMPLYGWLPDAHAMAPHAISAVLSGVLIKTPLFALSRVMMIMPAGSSAGELMGAAGAVTAIAAVIIALSQKDAKRLLAYHSISQIGYVVSAWGLAIHIGAKTPAGIALMTAAFLHAFYHALFKGLLFLSIGTTVDQAGERDVYRLRGAAAILKRGGERVPVTLITFLIGALAISAIPPLNGYASKIALTYTLKGTFHYYLLTAAGVGTVASFIKLSRIYWPPPGQGYTQLEHISDRQIPVSRKIAQTILGGLCIIGGISAPAVYSQVHQLISGAGKAAGTPPAFYSPDNLIKTLLITIGGLVLFLLVNTRAGAHMLHAIRNRPRSFQGLFVSYSLGTAVLALWLVTLHG